MPALVVGLGLLILLVVTIDVLVTALTMGGGGPLTNKVASWIWELALWIHGKKSNHRLLFMAGWVILVGTALLWFLLTWLGWTLIFSGFNDAVVNASTQIPAGLWERIYFVGYTISTLGMGDYQPEGRVWQIATAIASTNGFFLVTLAIAYLLPVIGATAKKRQVALYISSLGGTADDIIIRNWSGKSFGQLDQHLIAIAQELSGMGEMYLAYPVLRYIHAIERMRGFALSVAAFDDALTLLQYGVKASHRPDLSALHSARRASAAFLMTLKSAYVEPASETPPLPRLDLIRDAGIPTVSDREFWQATKYVTRRRQLLLSLVQKAGWTWDAVASTKTTSRASNLDDENVIESVEVH